jgi:hypothetical protein
MEKQQPMHSYKANIKEPLTDLQDDYSLFSSTDCFSTPLVCRGDLRIAGQVDILSAVSDELHKTTRTHDCCLCPVPRKKICGTPGIS